MQKYGIVYKITNNINGKAYVGQTIRSLNARIKQHMTCKRCIMHKAFKKYGFENFTIEILDTAYSKEELNQKEIYWISKFDTFKNGYNLCEGGGQTSGYHHTEKSKKIMSEYKKDLYNGENNPFYNKQHSEKSKKKMSEARKGMAHLNDNQVKKLRESHFHKKVINLDTNKVFDSVKEAANFYGLKDTHISRVCKGKRKRTGGFRWMYYEEYLKLHINCEAS